MDFIHSHDLLAMIGFLEILEADFPN